MSYLYFMKSTSLIPLIFLLIFSAFASTANAQKKEDTTSITYPVCLHFQSVCCGVPDEKKLKIWIAGFKKIYNIRKIRALHVGPLGREGEYDLYFSLNGLKKSTKQSFLKGIKKLSTGLKDPGMVTVEENAIFKKSDLPGTADVENIRY